MDLTLKNRLLTALSLCCLFSSVNSPALDRKTPEYLQEAFIEVAMRNEYDSGKHQIRKWQQPLRIWLDHRVGDEQKHTRLATMHIEHLAAITGHELQLATSLDQSNVHLVFTRQSRWTQEVADLLGAGAVKNLHSAVCIASVKVNSAGEIMKAWVVIPVDQAQMHGKLVACVVEELTQIMGLPNDSDKVFPSIFNDKTPQNLLSGLDGLLLKMLYYSEVTPGMSEDKVKRVLTPLLDSWEKDGTITNADKEIRRGKLYPLLGY